MAEADDRQRRRGQLYGRRKGPSLSARQARLVEAVLPGLRFEPGADGLTDPRQQFGGAVDDVWLEIGFGGGEHLAWQAAAHPTIGFLGAEAYLNGIAKLLVAVEDQGLGNIRVYDGDARQLLASLAEASIGRIFVLFPDPWPKRRHHKRRIVAPDVVGQIHRILKPGGLLRLASDSGAYVAWTLAHLRRHGGFAWLAETPRDWRERPPDWPETRYEAKARAQGRAPAFLSFRRRP